MPLQKNRQSLEWLVKQDGQCYTDPFDERALLAGGAFYFGGMQCL
jgi:hypothetical protein